MKEIFKKPQNVGTFYSKQKSYGTENNGNIEAQFID
jgi:hypothetical protein